LSETIIELASTSKTTTQAMRFHFVASQGRTVCRSRDFGEILIVDTGGRVVVCGFSAADGWEKEVGVLLVGVTGKSAPLAAGLVNWGVVRVGGGSCGGESITDGGRDCCSSCGIIDEDRNVGGELKVVCSSRSFNGRVGKNSPAGGDK